MRPRVFVSQPIPEPALEILREVADVSVFPRLDRNMSEDEWIMAAKRSDYLFVMGGNIITASIIKANPELKGIVFVHRRLPAGNSIDLETARATGIAVLFQHPWEAVYDRIAEATAISSSRCSSPSRTASWTPTGTRAPASSSRSIRWR